MTYTFTITLNLWEIIGLVLYFFYDGFVVYAGCSAAIAARAWAVIILELPKLAVAGVIDVLINQTFGRLLFWENTYTLTFSERLDLHYHDIDWKGSVARSIGNAINKILPSHIY
jgi:hypothetical protein